MSTNQCTALFSKSEVQFLFPSFNSLITPPNISCMNILFFKFYIITIGTAQWKGLLGLLPNCIRVPIFETSVRSLHFPVCVFFVQFGFLLFSSNMPVWLINDSKLTLRFQCVRVWLFDCVQFCDGLVNCHGCTRLFILAQKDGCMDCSLQVSNCTSCYQSLKKICVSSLRQHPFLQEYLPFLQMNIKKYCFASPGEELPREFGV